MDLVKRAGTNPTDAGEGVVVERDRPDFDIAHSENNILEWMRYLPPDCVQTMIHMGWDIST
jgi:hypothetical protein